jgi:predicted PurR-regulated permease PerM
MSSSDRPRDRIAEFLAQPTMRRAIALGAFLGLLIAFRKLLVLLVFFVVFERLIDWISTRVHQRWKLHPKLAHGLTALGVLGVVGTLLALGVLRVVHITAGARDPLIAQIAKIRESSLYQAAQEHFSEAADKLVAGAEGYATGALHLLNAAGHVVLFAVIGFILAVVFLLERDELTHWYRSISPLSLRGTVLRWFGYVAEAMLVTVQFQIVVAACNAALTLPVLLIVGIPHAASLALMIFLSGMVPVVGNFVAGAILTVLAYQAKGWIGVILFSALTFVLHKLESYYLNPRLAQRHVRLPGFVLIVSLILWEHLLGFAGLFLSFPFLFVAQRIAKDLPDESRGLISAESAPLAVPPAGPLKT